MTQNNKTLSNNTSKTVTPKNKSITNNSSKTATPKSNSRVDKSRSRIETNEEDLESGELGHAQPFGSKNPVMIKQRRQEIKSCHTFQKRAGGA